MSVKLNSFVSHKKINQEVTKVSVKQRVSLAYHGAAYSLLAFKRMRTSAVNANARHKRKTRSQALYWRFSLATVKKVIFTDEKDFTLELPTNRQNDRVYAKGRKSDICSNRLYHHRNRFLKKLMVSAGVSWNGKT